MVESRYTHGHHESVLRSHQARTAQNSAAYLLPHLRSGMSLLDVGCGPGTITIDLAARVAPGPVVGIDPSEAVIARARISAADAGSTVDFVTGDIYSAADRLAAARPAARAAGAVTYDVVHAHQVLQHLPDPVDALAAMRRLTTPGGILAARDADYGGMFWYPRPPGLEEWMTLYRRIARDNGGEPDAARHLPAWARAAGLDDVTVTGSLWCHATPADRDWWGGLWADRIRWSALAEQAVASRLATSSDLQRISDAWLAWAADPDGFFAIPHTEILCRV